MTKELLKQALEHWEAGQYAAYEAKLRAALGDEKAKGREAVGTYPMSISKLAAAIDEETRYAYSEIQRLIKTINYMVGIAERGRGFDCPANESPEKFLLDYVKYLEKSQAETKTPEAAAQPAREWVALTDFDIASAMTGQPEIGLIFTALCNIARAIESKLREKNAGQPVVKEN